jgi:BNR repeat-like domain
MIALPGGELLLAFNDHKVNRTPLSLALSRDGGATWTRVAVLEDDPEGAYGNYQIKHLGLPACLRHFLEHRSPFVAAFSALSHFVANTSMSCMIHATCGASTRAAHLL